MFGHYTDGFIAYTLIRPMFLINWAHDGIIISVLSFLNFCVIKDDLRKYYETHLGKCALMLKSGSQKIIFYPF